MQLLLRVEFDLFFCRPSDHHHTGTTRKDFTRGVPSLFELPKFSIGRSPFAVWHPYGTWNQMKFYSKSRCIHGAYSDPRSSVFFLWQPIHLATNGSCSDTRRTAHISTGSGWIDISSATKSKKFGDRLCSNLKGLPWGIPMEEFWCATRCPVEMGNFRIVAHFVSFSPSLGSISHIYDSICFALLRGV